MQGRRAIRVVSVIAVIVLGMSVPAPVVSAAVTLPFGFGDELVASLFQPTAIAFTPDGRMLVAQKLGPLRVITSGGTLLPTPALDLSAKLCGNSERGLLGIAVDPDFTSNHFIYLFYTFKRFTGCPVNTATVPVNRVSRFVLPASNVVAPSSEFVLIDNISSYGGYHNAGDLRFGKDGKLYVSVGDGGCDYADNSGCGSFNDAARDKHVMLGKILRVNRDGTIPADNPFNAMASARCGITGSAAPGVWCKETYAWGLRNPFRFAMDPAAAGARFYINDVGQNLWEEIDESKAGADYGWNVREAHCKTGSLTNCGPPPAGMTNPIFSYGHSTGCSSITGGAFVPADSGWPAAYLGKYLFGDFVCGGVFLLGSSGGGFTMTPFATDLGNSTVAHLEFGPPNPTRSLYYATFQAGGQIRRISFSPVPVAVIAAAPTSGPAPLSVTFDGSDSADPEGQALTYLWDFGDGDTATTAGPGVSHTYTADGSYVASLRVRDTEGLTSDPHTILVAVGNTPPVPTIASPAQGSYFRVGQTLTLSGSAMDEQEGAVPASRLTWTVLRFHDNHTHPWVGPVSGNNISFATPEPEDLQAATNSHLIVYLTATDSAGLSSTVSRTVLPIKVPLTFNTNPTGLTVKVAGQTFKALVTITSWSGWAFEIEAPSPQGKYQFVSWSDKGTRVHTITTPASPTWYTARFVKLALQ
jgi:glucose/arabinose dehydrogenase